MIADILRWLLLPAIIVAAWAVSKAHPERVRIVARGLPVVVAALLVLLAISGLVRHGGVLAEIHRWMAHVFFIVWWLGVPFGIGILLQQDFGKHPVAAIVQAIALLMGLAIVLVASMTGYLGPANLPPVDPAVGEETYNRFLVLHLVVLPGLCAALTVQWWWYFRPVANAKEDVS